MNIKYELSNTTNTQLRWTLRGDGKGLTRDYIQLVYIPHITMTKNDDI